ncbi:prostate androgen-regulated mucin-like protein 1 isoform X2 [Pipistrellus kuhlii]|uniref:Prostate androgen-regulated mucin-like protein 1 n=1 Tax=Pipistrellus kuhlii TaxID=59472 RepID=A0A7J8B4A6_PIPKU|nr:prostate androgen-regulated mucin-like protein 1 isoform X2 [Pipistrellus kuhlii]KAF6393170.1 prostate androgen-regulated mucin-like protein 1 [Pipistrellus kuhlii]
MICQILFALCVFSAGLRVQSMPTSAPLPVSLMEKIILPTPTTFWTSSPQSPPASPTSSTPSNSVPPITVTSVQTPVTPKNVVMVPTGQETTLTLEDPNTDALSTSSEVPLTPTPPTPTEHSLGTPEASVSATGSRSLSESPSPTSAQTPASSPPALSTSPPPILSTSPPEVSSVLDNTNHSSTETSTKTTGAPTTRESPAQEHSSGHTPTPHVTSELVPTEKTPQTTVPAKVTCILVDIETTTASPRVIMQEVEHALSSGSIAAITVTVIAVVLLVFGVAAYMKIRHSSYGRLLDDHDYGSWGNYNNPLYDDS